MAQKVRVAMPAKSMTFLNFYVGDKFGVYKAEGLGGLFRSHKD